MKLPEYYSLFDASYSEEIAGEQIYILRFDRIPSTRSEKMAYRGEVLKYFTDNGFKLLTKLENVVSASSKLVNKSSEERLYVNDEKQLIVKTKRTKGTKDVNFFILYDIENGEIENQMDLKTLFKFRAKKKKANISLIKSHGSGYLDLEEYELNVPKMDLLLNYGKSFKPIHETIIKRLNTKNDKGIVLLHGDPGTGKTTYIKYLTTLIRDKEVIFVPPMMAESLTDPSIIPFLMDYRNSILIIEDAEKVLGSRERGQINQSTSNLLNLTDGILGDCLNIQIIATFNTKRDNIDDAFLRKGRLIAEHKFVKLNVEESNKLLTHIGKDIQVEEEMALSDIYNIDVDVYKSTKERGKIGF
jgi:energy-coupling factor transporter ATP-binding protein EcfA2